MVDLSRQTTDADHDDPYRVRRLRPDDVDGFLDLDAVVWERDRGRTWFDWKYGANPYVNEPPVFVAERDGEIVGARPFMVFRIRGGSATRLALQPADTMVHPDHRRKGLFTRMTERAIEAYAAEEPAFCFNFPNSQSLPGYRKLGWEPAGVRITHYRLQNPGAVVSGSLDGQLQQALCRAASPLVRYVERGRTWYRRRRRGSEWDHSIEQFPGVPIALLASLYRQRIPDRLHAERHEEFYRWRLASPVWERTTYVARRGNESIAAVVARTRTTNDGVTVTQFADIVPLTGGATWRRALEALLARVIEDHRDSDLLAVADSTIPRDLLADFGFRRDDVAPLSWVTHHCTLAARPLGRQPWTVGGRSLTDRSDWTTTFVERDTT